MLGEQSAAALWRIGPLLVLPVHVIVVKQKRRRPGFIPHRQRLAPGDVTIRNGIPVTTPARTIADLPPHLRDDAAIKARVLGLIDDSGPRYRSRLERDVHRIVNELGLHPEVNAIVDGRERDLVFREQQVLIEVDGPHHDHPAQRARDERRDEQVAQAGWRTRRLKAR